MKNSIAKFMLPCAAGLLLAVARRSGPWRSAAGGRRGQRICRSAETAAAARLVAQWWFIPATGCGAPVGVGSGPLAFAAPFRRCVDRRKWVRRTTRMPGKKATGVPVPMRRRIERQRLRFLRRRETVEADVVRLRDVRVGEEPKSVRRHHIGAMTCQKLVRRDWSWPTAIHAVGGIGRSEREAAAGGLIPKFKIFGGWLVVPTTVRLARCWWPGRKHWRQSSGRLRRGRPGVG